MAKSTKKSDSTTLSFASIADAAAHSTEELANGIVHWDGVGKKAYREVFVRFAALVRKLGSEEKATKAVNAPITTLQNAKTLYRAFDRAVLTHKLVPEDWFLAEVNFTLAAAINSIFFKRGDKLAVEILKDRIMTSQGLAEIIHIYETGNTYAEAKAAETLKAAAKNVAGPAVKVSETSAVEETKASAAEAEAEAGVTKLERDPVSEFDSIAAALEEIALRLVASGNLDTAKVADRFDAIMQNISAAAAAKAA